MVSYEKIKTHIYNHQLIHKEAIRQYNKIKQKEYRTNEYSLRRISLIFLRILI